MMEVADIRKLAETLREARSWARLDEGTRAECERLADRLESDAVLYDSMRAEDARGTVSMGDVVLDRTARRAVVCGAPVRLRNMDFEILDCLATHAGEVLSRERIARAVWGHSAGTSRTLDTHINSIRRALDGAAPGAGQCISTCHGYGYGVFEWHCDATADLAR